MENQKCTSIVCLDLSTVFDTVNHKILLYVLKKLLLNYRTKKVKVLIWCQPCPLPCWYFGGALQPNPQQGTHPALVWVITLRWLRSVCSLHPKPGLLQVLSYLMFLLVIILPTHRGMEGWVNPPARLIRYWTWDLSHDSQLLYQLSYPSQITSTSPSLDLAIPFK